mmetsp:Transcript_10819/g.23317  ORF Transcript_10819/g.23317 Transcript_10819/m.23317 type:complete len:334 (+) Transcript_10819:3-1004(+)
MVQKHPYPASGQGGLEAALQLRPAQVAADEDQLVQALAFWPRRPRLLRLATEDHVDALEDELLVAAFHRQDALGAEDVRATFHQELGDPLIEPHLVALTGAFDANRAHRLVVLVVLFVLQKLRVCLKHTVQREALNADDLIQVNLRILGAEDGRQAVDAPDLLSQLLELCLRSNEVGLVDDDAVGEGHLLHGFVLHTFGLLLSEVLQGVLGVDHGDDPIQQHLRLDHVIGEERLRHRSRVRQPGGLDDHAVQLRAFQGGLLQDTPESLDEITAHGAADAAVVHFDDLLCTQALAACDELIVNADLAKLVLDDRIPLGMRLSQDMVQQGGLARP